MTDLKKIILMAIDKRDGNLVRITVLFFSTQEVDYEGNLGEPVSWEHFDFTYTEKP